MHRSRTPTVLLIVVVALMQAACTPPACDPNSDQYDPDECETLVGNLLESLTAHAYGIPQPPPATSDPPCPSSLVCLAPQCLYIQENGSFEEDDRSGPLLWHGDEAATTITSACHADQSLDFLATTPSGASASTSAQVYQVIDLAARIPQAQRDVFRRIRARAAFNIQSVEAFDDRRFGVRLDAYAGDPAAFPRTGDLETIPLQTSTYERLASVTDGLAYAADGAPWQVAAATLVLPVDADFVVVVLEHEEDVQNDTASREFLDHGVDYVQVAIDGGNVPPIANADRVLAIEDTPIRIDVTANDVDPNSRIDRSSVAITQPPPSGTATLEGDGRVRYVPNPDFVGTDLLTYTVADAEGLVSNEGRVIVVVRAENDAPIAVDDAYPIPEGDLLIVPTGLGVLANDTDADGDTLTAELVRDVDVGSLTLDPSGAFTYIAPTAFSGTTSFSYRATDGLVASNPATVALARAAAGLDLQALISGSTVPERVGQPFTYAVQVAKQPAATAVSGIQVAHRIPDGLVYLSHQATRGRYDLETGTWRLDLPAQTAAGFLTLSVRADTAGIWTADATITSGLDGDTDASNNAATAQLVVEPRYFLSVTASASPNTARVGEQVLVDVLVANGGGNAAAGVVATVELPAGLTFAEASGDGTYDPQTGRWTIGNLAPGPSASLRLTTTAATEGTWTVPATLTEGLTYDADPVNNADSVFVTVEPEGGT